MIIQFKPVNLDHFTGIVAGVTVDIKHENNNWRAYIDGRCTKQRFPSAKRAKDAAEAVAQKTFCDLAKLNIRAQQRPLRAA